MKCDELCKMARKGVNGARFDAVECRNVQERGPGRRELVDHGHDQR